MGDNRDAALAAAESAHDAMGPLLTYAREGALGLAGTPFAEMDPVSHLADALALTITIADPHAADEELRQLLGAVRRYLDR